MILIRYPLKKINKLPESQYLNKILIKVEVKELFTPISLKKSKNNSNKIKKLIKIYFSKL
jgi:hypothetical protein